MGDSIITFQDTEDLKSQFWLQIQNDNLNQHQTALHIVGQGSMYEWCFFGECDSVLEICDSKGWSGKRKQCNQNLLTRALQLNATVKRFHFW